jgi:hypothetical protein
MSTAADTSENETIEPSPEKGRSSPADFEAKIVCEQCGNEADRLHLGCPLCEDCCDCRPG